MKTNSFNRQKRQFRNLANQVNHLIVSGKWIRLSAARKNRIISKLNSLYRQLGSYFSQTELKKILAAAAIFIGFPLVSQAQSFAPPQLNPFGLAPDSVYLAAPEFADIDNDGDLDLFSGNYGLNSITFEFFENTGTVNDPIFALPQANPFGIIPANPVAFPAFADIDNDGDLDLFLGGKYLEREYDANIMFYENTGTDSSPAFSIPHANPFGIEPSYLFVMPEFADIDNDGDLDLFAGEGDGNIKFYENTGTDTVAHFAAPLQNPFGITPAYLFGSLAFSDIDHDGDLDLFVGEYYGDFQYFENTGTITSPAFAPQITNPFGLVPTTYYNFPTIADLDDDGDDDILAGEYYGMFQYFKNTEINIGISENSGDDIFYVFPNPATDVAYISFKEKIIVNSFNISIIDLKGRVVQTLFLTDSVQKIETGNLAPGMYFVRMLLKDKVYTQKLIVKK